MKITSTIRRTMLATLMVCATAVLGLQPLVFSSGAGCTCDAKVSVDANAFAAESSCCKPEAAACECGDSCKCSEDNDSNSPLPAIPTNETTEVVTPTLICAAPFVGYPRETEIKRVDDPNAVAEYAALSSQQTCVLLSRFTC